MKSEYIFRHIKLVLTGVAVAFALQIVFSAQANAQEQTFTQEEQQSEVQEEQEVQEEAPLTQLEQIALLSESLSAVGTAVSRSRSISNTQRIRLMTQLVELSRTIISVQRNAALREATVRERVISGTPETFVQMADTGLHRVEVQLDLDTYVAQVTEYYLDENDDVDRNPLRVTYDEVRRTVRVPAPTSSMSFTERADYVENYIVDQIIADTGITNRFDVNRVTTVSARNPEREKFIRMNSALANRLFEQFGVYSIIDRVVVYPRRNTARIEVYSDQGERFDFELERDQRRQADELVYIDDRYNAVTLFYAFSPFNMTAGDRDNESEPIPILRQTANNIDEEEALEFINELFDQIPFTRELRNADESFLSFLIDNGSIYRGSERDALSGDAQCVDGGDRRVLNEYVLQLLSGLEVSYNIDDLKIIYSPLAQEPEDGMVSGRGSCTGVRSFF